MSRHYETQNEHNFFQTFGREMVCYAWDFQ